MTKSVLATAASASVIAIMLAGAPAHAQSAPTADSDTPVADANAAQSPVSHDGGAPDASVQQTAEEKAIVVTGFRRSLTKEIQLKRESIGLRDSIVAEDIGKFPEANVADSLQRIPGVILSRDGSAG